MIYDKEFLISELHRFVRKNNRVPTRRDMTSKNGYPSFMVYVNHFGSWNKALITQGFKLNIQKRTGFEVCYKCGCCKKENQQWLTKGLTKGEVMCNNCYQNIHTDYMTGNLNKESSTGKATISEQVVKNVLNLEERHDCNFACGFKHPVDLYHKDRYKYINVKDSKLHYSKIRSPFWQFNLTQKVTPDTYVMLGYDEYRKNILHVWITDAVDDFVFNEKTGKLLIGKTITDIPDSLNDAEPWKVNPKPYNDMLHRMSDKRKETKGEECFLSNIDLGK